jgi:hypothetical protein
MEEESMIPFSEPERLKLVDERKLRMDQAWRMKQIGDLTYIRSLTFYNYLPSEAVVELNLLKLEKVKP